MEELLKPGATDKNETHHALKLERPKNIKRILSSLPAVSFIDQIKEGHFLVATDIFLREVFKLVAVGFHQRLRYNIF